MKYQHIPAALNTAQQSQRECVLSGGGPGPPEGGRQNISLLPFIAIFVSEF